MPWLLRDDEVLASVQVEGGPIGRGRGLLGRDSFDGALLLKPAMSVHTIGMRFPIDVAYCDNDLRVLDIVCAMRPWRVGRPRLAARGVIEATAGSFERWRLAVGDQLEIQ
jgi:uncharacterized membrane protein (UPF0127 family)